MNELETMVVLCARLKVLEEDIAHYEDKLEFLDKLIDNEEEYGMDTEQAIETWLRVNSELIDLKLKHNELERKYLNILKSLEK